MAIVATTVYWGFWRIGDWGSKAVFMMGWKSSPWCGNWATAGLYWNGYGCYCGVGNKSETAVDEFDAACEAHDLCYGDEVCEGAPQGILVDYPWTWSGTLSSEVSKICEK